MEAPPPLSPLSAAVAPSNCADSVSSSPRLRQTDSWDSDLLLPARPLKIRLMCSYGGHIVPRPHDKSLCYVGGDTRIIVIDRQTSLADLHNRLSTTLLHCQPFSLKYQLPNEDLDSLISVTIDEDLENMVEEYDRLNRVGGGSKPGRLRLFLFPDSSKVEQVLAETASMKSKDWFLNALNGGKTTPTSAGASDHGNSESSSVNCLLGLDEGLSGESGIVKGMESQLEDTKGSGDADGNGANKTLINREVHSVPVSPMLEISSSFGSTASSPSLVNLPPIRVRVGENPKVGIDEHFQQMSVGVGRDITSQRQRPEAGAFAVESVAGDVAVSGLPIFVGGEYADRLVSDVEKLDHAGYKMAPVVVQQPQVPAQYLPQQAQFQQIPAVANGLASPDSISSAVDTNYLDQNNSTVQMQPQVQDSSYVWPSQYDQSHSHLQQQFIRGGFQYIPAGAVPMTSYYPMYPSQQQHHPHSSMLDQQYPVYFVPARQAKSYNLPVQSQSFCGFTTSVSSLPQPPPSYKQAKNAPPQPEMAAGMYRTATGAPQLIQVSSNQHPAQFLGFSQAHHPSQSVPPASTSNSTHASEFADPANPQIYGAQPSPPQFVAQYKTLTTSSAVSPEASAQLSTEYIKN